eukprot:4467801-Pleurochrysis_carterae.AAC.1
MKRGCAPGSSSCAAPTLMAAQRAATLSVDRCVGEAGQAGLFNGSEAAFAARSVATCALSDASSARSSSRRSDSTRSSS